VAEDFICKAFVKTSPSSVIIGCESKHRALRQAEVENMGRTDSCPERK